MNLEELAKRLELFVASSLDLSDWYEVDDVNPRDVLLAAAAACKELEDKRKALIFPNRRDNDALRGVIDGESDPLLLDATDAALAKCGEVP